MFEFIDTVVIGTSLTELSDERRAGRPRRGPGLRGAGRSGSRLPAAAGPTPRARISRRPSSRRPWRWRRCSPCAVWTSRSPGWASARRRSPSKVIAYGPPHRVVIEAAEEMKRRPDRGRLDGVAAALEAVRLDRRPGDPQGDAAGADGPRPAAAAAAAGADAGRSVAAVGGGVPPGPRSPGPDRRRARDAARGRVRDLPAGSRDARRNERSAAGERGGGPGGAGGVRAAATPPGAFAGRPRGCCTGRWRRRSGSGRRSGRPTSSFSAPTAGAGSSASCSAAWPRTWSAGGRRTCWWSRPSWPPRPCGYRPGKKWPRSPE